MHFIADILEYLTATNNKSSPKVKVLLFHVSLDMVNIYQNLVSAGACDSFQEDQSTDNLVISIL